jgi:hypothetical protein
MDVVFFVSSRQINELKPQQLDKLIEYFKAILVGFCLGLGRVRPVFVFDEHLPAEFG